MSDSIIIIAGPTASGKTNLAINIAKKLDAEIINADSLQVYIENPILSAQPTEEERQGIAHHLFGYIEGYEDYNVARWIKDAVNEIQKAQKKVILVGGTGFYLKHLIFGLNSVPDIPQDIRNETRKLFENIGAYEFHKMLREIDQESADNLDYNNRNRTMRAFEVIKATGKSINYWRRQNSENFFPVNKFKLIILMPERDKLYANCNKRFLEMLDRGALQEVENLLKKSYKLDSGIMKSHGVPELSKYLFGEFTIDQATEKAQQVVRNYAKRQITWFKHQFKHPELNIQIVEDPKTCLDKIII